MSFTDVSVRVQSFLSPLNGLRGAVNHVGNLLVGVPQRQQIDDALSTFIGDDVADVPGDDAAFAVARTGGGVALLVGETLPTQGSLAIL